MTDDPEEAEEAINSTGYRMLKIIWVARTVKRGWRRIHSNVGGFGLFNFITEQLIEPLNVLLQHYPIDTPLSKKLNASIRYLHLQLRTNMCLLDLCYADCLYLAPLSWMKMLWRTLQVPGFVVRLKYETIPNTRRGDYFIMKSVIK